MPEADPADTEELDETTHRRAVRDRYAGLARPDDAPDGGCCSSDGCCDDGGPTTEDHDDDTVQLLGYSADEIESVAGEANLGLGCGNPQAIASLEPGETVLDLGSGAGFDCFLAAQAVGDSGRVIGVDMTQEMVEKARENARTNQSQDVEFRLGEIEHLPVADGTVDVVISNCVVNLSPDKAQVFREAFRVLRPGGRLAIADVVRTADIPDDMRADPESLSSCIGGAASIKELERLLDVAGFERIDIGPKDGSERFIREWDADRDLSEFLVSASITSRKPPLPATKEA